MHIAASASKAALTDALMRIDEGDEQVLLGSVDEITPASHAVQQRLGLLKGNITAGEGAHFFLLGKEPVQPICTYHKRRGNLHRPSPCRRSE